MHHHFKKIVLAVMAVLVLAVPVAVTTSPAHAAVKHRIVFRAWGAESRARVDVSGRTDITMMRSLPYRTTQFLSGFDRSFAMMSVEDPHGFSTVGCSITDNGRLVARDVSTFGIALCMHP